MNIKKTYCTKRGEVATLIMLASLAVVTLGTVLGSLIPTSPQTTRSNAQATNPATALPPLNTAPVPPGQQQESGITGDISYYTEKCMVQVNVNYGQPTFWINLFDDRGNNVTASLGVIASTRKSGIIRWNPYAQTGANNAIDPNELQVIKYTPSYMLDRYQRPSWLGVGKTHVKIMRTDNPQNPNVTVYYSQFDVDGCISPVGDNATTPVQPKFTPTPTLSHYVWSMTNDPADVCNIRVCEDGPRPADPLRYFTVDYNGTRLFQTANQSVLNKPIQVGGNVQCWDFPGRLLTYSKLEPYVGKKVTVAMRSLPTVGSDGFLNVQKDYTVDYSCFPNVPTPTTPPSITPSPTPTTPPSPTPTLPGSHYQLDLYKLQSSNETPFYPECWAVWSDRCTNIPSHVETHDYCAASSTEKRLEHTNTTADCEALRCDYHECGGVCTAVYPPNWNGPKTDYICVKAPPTLTQDKSVPPGCTVACTPNGLQTVGSCNSSCPLPSNTPIPTATPAPKGQTYQIDLTFAKPFRAPSNLPDTPWASYSSWGDSCPAPAPQLNLTTPENGYLYSGGTVQGAAVFTNKTDYCMPMECVAATCGLTTAGKCQTALDERGNPTNYAGCSSTGGTPSDQFSVKQFDQKVVPPGCTATCTMNGLNVTCPNNQPVACPSTKTYQLDWAEHQPGQSYNEDRGFCWASWADSCSNIRENNSNRVMPDPKGTSKTYACEGSTSVNNSGTASSNVVVYKPTQDTPLNCVFFQCDACVTVSNPAPSDRDLAQCNTGLRKNYEVTVPAGCTGKCTAGGAVIEGSDPKCTAAANNVKATTTLYSRGKKISETSGLKPTSNSHIPGAAKRAPLATTNAQKLNTRLNFAGCARSAFKSLAACDVNADGKVNALDLQILADK